LETSVNNAINPTKKASGFIAMLLIRVRDLVL
jgi:hypothetical protein